MAPIAITPANDLALRTSLTTTFDDTLRFYLNGTRVVLDDIDPEITLLEYLRGIGLTGTKLCALHLLHHQFMFVGLQRLTRSKWLWRGWMRCLHRRYIAV